MVGLAERQQVFNSYSKLAPVPGPALIWHDAWLYSSQMPEHLATRRGIHRGAKKYSWCPLFKKGGRRVCSNFTPQPPFLRVPGFWVFYKLLFYWFWELLVLSFCISWLVPLHQFYLASFSLLVLFMVILWFIFKSLSSCLPCVSMSCLVFVFCYFPFLLW